MNDSTQQVDVFALNDLVLAYFGARADEVSLDSARRSVRCVLYETFPVVFLVNGTHGEFGARVIRSDGTAQNRFFGELMSMKADEESIRQSLARVDEWCRLQLSPAFLDRFESAVTPTSTDGEPTA